MRSLLLLLISGTLLGAPNPWVTGTLGTLIPGAGYLNNGNTKSGILGLSLLIPIVGKYHLTTPTSEGKIAKTNIGLAARNVFGYTVYDSFQDAIDLNGRPETVVSIPHYTFKDMYFAPLRSRNYQTWKVFVPVGLATLGLVSNVAQKGIHRKVNIGTSAVALPLIVLQSLLIGVGEEAEFRGFYYPALSELTSSKWAGALLQAVYFGSGHTGFWGASSPPITGIIFRETNTIDPNREYRTNFLDNHEVLTKNELEIVRFLATTLIGAFDAYIVSTEEDGLLKSIAGHAAWDAILLTSHFLTGGENPIYFSVGFRL